MTARERAKALIARCMIATEEDIAAAIEAAVAEEREACAALVDDLAAAATDDSWYALEKAADAIRARGKEPAS